MNYYNEFDHNAAEWLRELIADGSIPPGDVDERSITDVRADELLGYTQCHFFAGIGGWSLALRLAGWPDNRPVWTGSCPCQPFSTAGKRKGYEDERDLWPVFFRLINECKPETVFGEQVASSDVVGSSQEAAFVDAVRRGDIARANKLAHQINRSASLHYHHRWLDRVRADLGSAGYAVRNEVLGAHSVGAPHRRYRLYWGAVSVADNASWQHPRSVSGRSTDSAAQGGGEAAESSGLCGNGGVAENSDGGGCGGRNDGNQAGRGREVQVEGLGDDCGVDDAESIGRGICNAENVRQADGEINAFANASCGGDRVAHMQGDRRDERRAEPDGRGASSGCGDIGIPNPTGERRGEARGAGERSAERSSDGGADIGMADIGSAGLEGRTGKQLPDQMLSWPNGLASLSPWSKFALVYCRDEKIRRVPAESILFRMADGLSGDVDGIGVAGISEAGGFPLTTKKEGRSMLLKGYGNAIVPQVASEFIGAFMEA